jgi:hypothetical protein
MGHATPKRKLSPLAYGVAEAAEVSHRGKTRIKRAISTGDLPAKKDGKSTIVLDLDLREWLASLPDLVPAHSQHLDDGNAESDCETQAHAIQQASSYRGFAKNKKRKVVDESRRLQPQRSSRGER